MLRRSTLSVSVSNFSDEDSLINHLIDKIGFPNLYERTWHGLAEHFFYDSEMKLPELLIVTGIDNLEESLPEAANKLRDCIYSQAASGNSLMVIFKNEKKSKSNSIEFPIILINEELTKRDGLVITISKPRINFEKPRLEGNLELINSKFCDSNGNVFILKNIRIIGKSKNLWKAITLNNFKYLEIGEYEFQETKSKITFKDFKKIASRLMCHETIESAQEEYCKYIEESDTFEEVIGKFVLGMQN